MQQNESCLTKNFFLKSLLVAFFFFIYTDYMGYSKIGLIISILLVVSILFLSLFKFSSALSLTLYVIFLSARVPRNLTYIIEELRIAKKLEFYSIINSNIAGFSLAQWLFLSLGIIAFLNLIKNKAKFTLEKSIKQLFIILIFVITSMYLATLLDTIFFRNVFDIRTFISDHRFFIILLSSLIIGLYYTKIERNYLQNLTRDLLFIGITSGFKTIFFVLNDCITKIFNVDFSSQPYLLLPLILAIIFAFSKKYGFCKTILLSLLVFLGGFSITRGDLILFILDLVLFICILLILRGNINFKLYRIKIITVLLILLILLPPIVLYNLNKTAFIFLKFKINFFTKEIWSGKVSESPSLRIYEFKNIIAEAGDLYYPLLIGKGFGGYFTFTHYPADFKFGLFDYSKKELKSNTFFRPHTFINSFFLKGGLLLIFFYLSLIFYFFLLGINLLNRKDSNVILIGSLSIFFSPFALNMFWRPIYIFFFGILLIALIEINCELKNQKEDSSQNTNLVLIDRKRK